MSDIFLKVFLKQKCVYWAPDAVADPNAKPTYSTPPIELKCRWEDRAETVVDKDGRTRTSKSFVMVDRDIKEKGLLKLGALAAITDINNPLKNGDVWEIKTFNKIPAPNGKKFVREVIL
jgi:hypothetical protein